MKSLNELEMEMKYFNKGRESLLNVLRSKNYYERLGVPNDTDSKQLKQKYKTLTLKWHPDMIGKLGSLFANKDRFTTFMSEVFMLFKDAYQTLSDDKDR